MKRFEQKRKIRKYFYSKITIIALLFFTFILLRGSVRVYEKARISMDRKNFSAGRLVQLNERKDHLEKEINRLDTRIGIEEELRNRYSFAKEGEKMIIIVDEENEAESVEKTPEKGPKLTEKVFSWFKRVTLLE